MRKAMRSHRTLSEVTEKYLREHPGEIDDYMNILFDEYAESGEVAILMSSLQIVSSVKGVGHAELQKALSENGDPLFSSVNAILKAMGYRLMPQKLSQTQ